LVVGGGVLGHAALTASRGLVEEREQVRQLLGSVFLAGGAAHLLEAGADGGTDGAVDLIGLRGGLDAFLGGLMGRQSALPAKNWGQRITNRCRGHKGAGTVCGPSFEVRDSFGVRPPEGSGLGQNE